MLGRSLTLFTLFGIEIRVNLGWAMIAGLIAWSLAVGVFPQLYDGLEPSDYWWMALVAIAGLAVSIIAHELAHSLVARRFGTKVSSITLFLFGGVAALEDEPESPRAEFLIAIAGPAMSLVLALLFQSLANALSLGAGPGGAAAAVASYLALLNLILALFNLVPAFPMDGGRALRAGLWAWRGNYREATQIASDAGKMFSIVFMALGLVAILAGNFAGGLWWILIGAFIRSAAVGAWSTVAVEAALEDISAGQLMTRQPATVPADKPLSRLVEEDILGRGHDLFPVLDGTRPIGSIGVKEVRAVARERWAGTEVGAAMTPLAEGHTIAAGAPAVEALRRMQSGGLSRLLVVDPAGELAGILVLKDMMEWINTRLALSERA